MNKVKKYQWDTTRPIESDSQGYGSLRFDDYYPTGVPPPEGPRAEDTEAFPSGMVSHGAYNDEQPGTPERRRLFE